MADGAGAAGPLCPSHCRGRPSVAPRDTGPFMACRRFAGGETSLSRSVSGTRILQRCWKSGWGDSGGVRCLACGRAMAAGRRPRRPSIGPKTSQAEPGMAIDRWRGRVILQRTGTAADHRQSEPAAGLEFHPPIAEPVAGTGPRKVGEHVMGRTRRNDVRGSGGARQRVGN